MLNVGDPAPDIQVMDDTGQPFDLKEMRGKRVVLFFYPRANTPEAAPSWRRKEFR